MPQVTGRQSAGLGIVSLEVGVGWFFQSCGAPVKTTSAPALRKLLSAHAHHLVDSSRGTIACGSKTQFHSGNANQQSQSPGTPQTQGRQPLWIFCHYPHCYSGVPCTLCPFLRKEVKFGCKNFLGHFSCPFISPAPLSPGNPLAPAEPGEPLFPLN